MNGTQTARRRLGGTPTRELAGGVPPLPAAPRFGPATDHPGSCASRLRVAGSVATTAQGQHSAAVVA